MKPNNFLIFLITLITLSSFGQVEVIIQNLQYTNNGDPTESASNCGTIDLKSSTSTSIDFGIDLSKPNGQVVSTSTIYIYTKKSSSDGRVQQGSQITVQDLSWNHPTSGDDTFSASSGTFSINASDFNVSGGTLYVVFKTNSDVEYESCKYTIVKDLLPEFNISPTSVSIGCGSTSQETFTVVNVHNSPGALSYIWNVGTGWKRNGVAVSGTIATTTNSITLEPVSPTSLPSSVSVTTTLDGDTYGPKTATVSRGSYNPINEITGSNQLCSNATYSVGNLPAGTTLGSWASSNPAIATMATNSNNQGVLTAVGNGIITVSATLTNACGQTATITKNNIGVGSPTVSNYGISGNSTNIYTNSVSYFSVSPVTGNPSYYWWITPAGGCSAGSGPTINNVNPYTSSSTSAQINWGSCPGTYSVVCWAINDCGTTSIGQKFVTVKDIYDPCDNNFSIMVTPNPNRGKKIDVTINLLPDPEPCPTLALARTAVETYHVAVYDFYGVQRFTGNYKSEKFTLGKLKLKKGVYIIKVTSSSGVKESKTLIID